jgi:hypothetical protein
MDGFRTDGRRPTLKDSSMAKRKKTSLLAGRKTGKAAKKAGPARKSASKAGRSPAKAAKAGRKASPARSAAKKSTKKAGKKAAPKRAAVKKAAAKKAAGATRRPAPKAARTAPKKAAKAPARKAKAPIRRAAPVVGKVARGAAPMLSPRKSAGGGPKRAKNPAPIRGAIPSSLGLDSGASAARSGREELLQHIKEHTESSPAITAGDVDADWQLAYSSGDEAPGGDNPTPDQDVVDEIGEALGVNYEDGEELKGAAKIEDRDRHRWELDPASKDDFDE